ncbi:MAG: Transcriptional regulator, XRE family [Microgenomates group bacterium GW2011_GWC1_41_8]|uniref:Transcriptional regulator, XRE family n=2 Tax=Candidatus Roizmaniibacteriota TaxID=1752723 RepID=A0A0G0WB90_9BACT|nr:MAG: Transcriptional regulator, XRE family [Candidatus Levybacteria bacterium GW2011_GWA2_40_16]KKR72502.1 MAG: Transcriptional regulator, XRE family [Candidatus Roizmanbacteria bacterium GW2011_GWB1_40_7]KKR94029.1 MAG: Transcriptional regulator, XRE family [Candidatus Roizmanbacteria bacterium GW2011_GWA1_41_13]KKS23497.1 MAG: Transcriptional regulator, XRE family [Microgenomates group bacterium GW2011_GWC1_41_8]
MSMRSVGEILKAARHKKGMTIAEVSDLTKIRKKYLEHIENSKWVELPGAAYITGFVKRYADTVDLDAEKVSIVFRREFTYQQKQEVLPESIKNPPLNRSPIFLTIKRFLSKLIG